LWFLNKSYPPVEVVPVAVFVSKLGVPEEQRQEAARAKKFAKTASHLRNPKYSTTSKIL
jgi:hypothetical protein